MASKRPEYSCQSVIFCVATVATSTDTAGSGMDATAFRAMPVLTRSTAMPPKKMAAASAAIAYRLRSKSIIVLGPRLLKTGYEFAKRASIIYVAQRQISTNFLPTLFACSEQSYSGFNANVVVSISYWEKLLDRFQAMQVFPRVVDANSFTQAADSLGLPRA